MPGVKLAQIGNKKEHSKPLLFRFPIVWGSSNPPGQTPLKVPNIEIDFDVSVDRKLWQIVTSKSNSRIYNRVQDEYLM